MTVTAPLSPPLPVESEGPRRTSHSTHLLLRPEGLESPDPDSECGHKRLGGGRGSKMIPFPQVNNTEVNTSAQPGKRKRWGQWS